MDITTAYKHPKEYAGLTFNSDRAQLYAKARVEVNCLRCELFGGRDHDFSECNIRHKDKDCTCPPECRKPFSLIQPEIHIKCPSD